jgi:hypothetical protein
MTNLRSPIRINRWQIGVRILQIYIAHCTSPNVVPGDCQHRFVVIDPSSCPYSRPTISWKPLLLPLDLQIKLWLVQGGNILPPLVSDRLWKLQKFWCSLNAVYFSESVRLWGTHLRSPKFPSPGLSQMAMCCWFRHHYFLSNLTDWKKYFLSEHKGDALVKTEITFQFPDERAVYFSLIKQISEHISRPSNSWQCSSRARG